MGYLETLPQELLILITDHLQRYDCMLLRLVSPIFHFLRSRICTIIYFNGGPTDTGKLRKLCKRINDKGNLARAMPREFIFDTSSANFSGDSFPEAMMRTKRLIHHLAQSPVTVSKIRLIGDQKLIHLVFHFFWLADINSVQHVATTFMHLPHQNAYTAGPGGYGSGFWWNVKTLQWARIMSIRWTPYCQSLTDLQDLHIGCDHSGRDILRVHKDLNDSRRTVDDRMELPTGLRRLTLSCEGVRYWWLSGTILELPRLEEVTFLDVNLLVSAPDFKEEKKKKKKEKEGTRGLPVRLRDSWQRFAERFDCLNSGSSPQGRLVLGGIMENGWRVGVDDSALRTVTILSAAKTKKCRLNVNAASNREWINCV